MLVSAVMLPLSLGLYVLSLTMNVATVHRAFKVLGVGPESSESLKLLTTIRTLYEDGDVGLAIVIIAFTLIFPVGKYLALLFVMLSRSSRNRNRVLLWIKNLGQWSMGDVFVVAFLVVIIRVNNSIAQIQVEVLPGLWVFAASVLLSMIVSALLGFHAARQADRSARLPELANVDLRLQAETVAASEGTSTEH
jgi:hypothetical protein